MTLADMPPVSFEDYLRLPGVNWSTLKAMGDSPAHYRVACDQGHKDTAALNTGRLIDCLLFTPELYASRYAVRPAAFQNYQTKAAKEWRDSIVSSGMEPTTEDAADAARAIVKAVRAHPHAGRFLAAGRYQVPLTWTDKETGLPCKGLADLIGSAFGGFVIDGKSTVSAAKRKYLRDFAKFKYHGQLAFYRMGYEAVHGERPSFIGHIVYEKTPPYDVGLFAFDSYIIDAGEDEAHEFLRRVADCRARGEWPGRYPDIEHVLDTDVPAYIYGDESEDVTVTTTEE